MILYEFELSIKNKGIARREFEVKECEKTYKCVKRIDGNAEYWGNKNFNYRYLSTLSKDMVDIGEIVKDCEKLFYYSTKDDVQTVRKLFIDYINEKIIPSQEARIVAEQKKLEDTKQCYNDILARYTADCRCDIKGTCPATLLSCIDEEHLKTDEDKLKEIATNIVAILEDCGFDNITDSSGCFAIKEFEDGTERFVDVHKSMDGLNPHYVVCCSYENEQSDYKFTDDLSVEGLIEVLREIYKSETRSIECVNKEHDLDR